MANPLKGEAPIKALGKVFTFVLDFNALCELEDVAPSVMDRGLIGLGPRAVRAILARGLRQHHGELADETAGAILNETGVWAFYKAFKASTSITWAKLPEELEAVPGDPVNPQTAAGTGSANS